MKKFVWIVIIFIIPIIIYYAFTFSLFPVEEKFLKEFTNRSGEKFKIYLIGGNATTGEVIQIRKEVSDGDKIIKSIEGYNYVGKIFPINDTLISIILNDTSYVTNSPDTSIINLNN